MRPLSLPQASWNNRDFVLGMVTKNWRDLRSEGSERSDVDDRDEQKKGLEDDVRDERPTSCFGYQKKPGMPSLSFRLSLSPTLRTTVPHQDGAGVGVFCLEGGPEIWTPEPWETWPGRGMPRRSAAETGRSPRWPSVRRRMPSKPAGGFANQTDGA